MTCQSEALRSMLIGGLFDSDPLVPPDAARLLGELGAPWAVDSLLQQVAASRYYTKTATIEALRRIGDRRATEILRRLVEAPNVPDDWYWHGFKTVRAAAALVLLHWGDETGLPFLDELAGRGDVVFRVWYAPTVLRLSDESPAARPLKARLTPPVLCGEEGAGPTPIDPAQWVLIAESLEQVGTPPAVERLRTLTGHFSRYVRGRAVTGLLAVDPSAVSVAAHLFESDPADFTRLQAAFALARAGHADAAEYLARAATTLDDAFDRAVAIGLLGKLGRAEYAAVAAAAGAHPDPWVRQVAIEALVHMGASPARSAATRALEDPALRVRLQAAAGIITLDEDVAS
jgi:HEAT repeat protein